MIQFQENAWTEGRMEGQKDGQTLFYRTLPATAPLRVQKVHRLSNKKLLHYRQHAKNQFNP